MKLSLFVQKIYEEDEQSTNTTSMDSDLHDLEDKCTGNTLVSKEKCFWFIFDDIQVQKSFKFLSFLLSQIHEDNDMTPDPVFFEDDEMDEKMTIQHESDMIDSKEQSIFANAEGDESEMDESIQDFQKNAFLE
eukprot:MONOS_6671.1-p1 / transcript=MONOS_6671.1 / gene=MONOS_6671 / organism=Monocercomonoides_exilis_PA203 / gene_product=unspecified product / transcript_product=unspecified product / location=Mono_scaffold00214:58831-59280(-) / protein_length=133 / sequence_SO=supercontig / SO=protein_coding / is_pseudo=false